MVVSDRFLEMAYFNTSSVRHKYSVFSNKNPLDNNNSLFVVVIILSTFFSNNLSNVPA